MTRLQKFLPGDRMPLLYPSVGAKVCNRFCFRVSIGIHFL
jgi:hypothetical protein